MSTKPKTYYKEYAASLVMLLFAAGFGYQAVKEYTDKSRKAQAEILPFKSADIIGSISEFRGEASSQYTIVEFGDYQCSPCHIAAQQLPAIIDQYTGKVRYCFRHFPLTNIHPYAYRAAIIAEIAQQQGCYWPVHDDLYALDAKSFDDAAIDDIIKRRHLNGLEADKKRISKAKSKIMADIHDAEKFGIKSTPSFILCEPNGRVVYLHNLSQINEYVH